MAHPCRHACACARRRWLCARAIWPLTWTCSFHSGCGYCSIQRVKDTMFHHHQDREGVTNKTKQQVNAQCPCRTKHSARDSQCDRERNRGSSALCGGQHACLFEGGEGRRTDGRRLTSNELLRLPKPPGLPRAASRCPAASLGVLRCKPGGPQRPWLSAAGQESSGRTYRLPSWVGHQYMGGPRRGTDHPVRQ